MLRMNNYKLVWIMGLSLCLFGAGRAFANEGGKMKLVSSAFSQNQAIPAKYTCKGKDVSPPLSFSNVPDGAASLALIVDDPDAPRGVFDHWIVWNITPDTKELKEGASVPKQGINGYGEQRYKGPCPPPGAAHRYRFKLYALNILLDLPEGSTKAQLEEAMQGHILAQTELVGTFKR